MKRSALGIVLFIAASAPQARAAVPAGYAGTPFQGTPWPVPGRIDFENYDDGGQDVAWHVDDSTANFGQTGCAGNDYRLGVHPEICQTNTSPGENDLFSQGPLLGTHYPSDAMPQSKYVGYTHPTDWVKLTVNVAQAGTYKLSSTWASQPGGANGIHFQISVNGTLKADVMLTGTGDYHNWVAFPDFASVDLDAGVQVLEFAPKSFHLNYDYLQLSRVLPDGGVDDGGNPAGGSGGASSGGSAGASAGGATGGTIGVGTSGAPGAGAGASASGNGGSGGTEPTTNLGGSAGSGTAAQGGSAASAGTGNAAANASPAANGSCRIGVSDPTRRSEFALLLALGALFARRTRRVRPDKNSD